VEINGKDAEILEFEAKNSQLLEVIFTENAEGYLCIGRIYERISGKSAILNLSPLCNGEYSPYLILEEETIILPSIKKEERKILPVEYGLEQIRPLSLREKRNSHRIRLLEERIKKLEDMIYGSKIF
jgi:hypothetical protein